MSGRSEVSRSDLENVARLLRQRAEMGSGDVFLEGMSREEALALTRRGARGKTTAGPGGSTQPPARSEVASRQASGPRPEAQSRPRPQASTELPVLPSSYEAVREEALACTRCRLSETRTQVVFSDGVVDARLVVVGEAPGANEDATGLPFVGAAGQFLDLLLACVDLSRSDSVYICNVLKCRPPGNRNPMPDEIEACAPFLIKQLESIQPQAILGVGTFAAQWLTGQQKPLGRLRGSVHAYAGVPLVVTYHPAALLRNGNWTRSFWDDLQLLRRVMDGA